MRSFAGAPLRKLVGHFIAHDVHMPRGPSAVYRDMVFPDVGSEVEDSFFGTLVAASVRMVGLTAFPRFLRAV
ncbi:hypothetical protein HYQ44_015658 [Verticillium longisporum]|nr:hypothetical protein HYQ44_015658 [Verticillium longisporum]